MLVIKLVVLLTAATACLGLVPYVAGCWMRCSGRLSRVRGEIGAPVLGFVSSLVIAFICLAQVIPREAFEPAMVIWFTVSAAIIAVGAFMAGLADPITEQL